MKNGIIIFKRGSYLIYLIVQKKEKGKRYQERRERRVKGESLDQERGDRGEMIERNESSLGGEVRARINSP